VQPGKRPGRQPPPKNSPAVLGPLTWPNEETTACLTTTSTSRGSCPKSMDDLRGRTPEELRKMLEVLDAHLKVRCNQSGTRGRAPRPDRRGGVRVQRRDGPPHRDRGSGSTSTRRSAEVFRRRPAVGAAGHGQHPVRPSNDPAGDTRRLTQPTKPRDKALRVLGLPPDDGRPVPTRQKDPGRQSCSAATRSWPRRILVTENEDYRSAWIRP